jgi:hypothetical protein
MEAIEQAKHTPGPWHVSMSGAYQRVYAKNDGGEIAVAEMRSLAGYRPHWETKANANLIAAAPELLEALKAYVANDANQQLDDDEMYANAVAAIRKATGAQS